MDKTTLLKKLEAMLDNARTTKQWGTIELTLKDGEVVVMHETKSIKLGGNNPNDRYEHR